ncbi:MAG TPA: SDR family NAD(P)-dependent oxidoreductase [Myxococcota bacterium]|nr:SDR family NAD(P)-dependent oxidoreductase [Myxococcota bacterium]
MPQLLDGKRAIVTGGASGIGLAVCRRFSAEGARLAIFDLNAEAAERTAKELGGLAYAIDVADGGALESAVRSAAERMGGLDILVNNAGCSHVGLLHETPPEAWERVLAVNLTGVYHGMRAAIPIMLARGGGSVVSNASGSGPRPTRGELAYSAAKAGVVALTMGAAQEYGPTVRVNCVSPGMIRTPLSELLFRIPKALDPVLAATPLARTGTPEDVASVILFLASDLSGFMTGQNLLVDGGLGLAQAGIDVVLKRMLAHRRAGSAEG